MIPINNLLVYKSYNLGQNPHIPLSDSRTTDRSAETFNVYSIVLSSNIIKSYSFEISHNEFKNYITTPPFRTDNENHTYIQTPRIFFFYTNF